MRRVRIRNTSAALAFIGVPVLGYASGETDIKILLLGSLFGVVSVFSLYQRAKPVFWPKQEPILFKREPRWWEGRAFKELARKAKNSNSEK